MEPGQSRITSFPHFGEVPQAQEVEAIWAEPISQALLYRHETRRQQEVASRFSPGKAGTHQTTMVVQFMSATTNKMDEVPRNLDESGPCKEAGVTTLR